MPKKTRADVLTKAFILSQLRGLASIIAAEVEMMAIAFDFEQVPGLREWATELANRRTREKEIRLLRHLLEHRFGTLLEWARQNCKRRADRNLGLAIA